MSAGSPSWEKKEVVRPTVEYHPSVWGDYFIHLPPSIDQESRAGMGERLERLKEEVKRLFTDDNDMLNKMSLVDTLQRLGLAYHFEEDIDKTLDHLYESQVDGKDLHDVALRFRLLRQQGYRISTDDFKVFKDEDGHFAETLSDDVKGLLSLYEAAYLATHGEVILGEAIDFCKKHLSSKLISHDVEPRVAVEIAHAMDIPLHRRARRLDARHYISVYEALEGHNDQLLELAKLDFNLLLSLHQEEVKNICLWWKKLGLMTKLNFARDRVVECYYWILEVYSQTSMSRARTMMTKVIALASVLDDIYDSYGTLEELEVFTPIFQRWDNIGVQSQLPEYMKVYLIALHKTFKEVEDELSRDGHSYRMDFLKKETKDLAAVYLEEAKWRNEGHIPTFEVHLSISLKTSGYPLLACAALVGMDEIATKEAFDWISGFPKLIRASSIIARLMDDLVTHELEQQREHVASTVQCYMKDYGASLEETYGKFQVMLEDAWKDLNQEYLKPTALPIPLLTPAIDLARMIVMLYKDGDTYTHSSKVTKDRIAVLLTQPIPI